MKTFFAAAALACAAQAADRREAEFVAWVVQHAKSYGTVAEYNFRFEQFRNVAKELVEFRSRNPDSTSTVGHNKFSDFTEEEKKKLASYKGRATNDAEPHMLEADSLPTEVDWVKAGAVNTIQDQGKCGSCWAFSAIASLEGQHFVKSGELLKLSEQQCVDCDPESYGCNGGWQDNCFFYVMDNGGISHDKDYPYKAYQDSCWAEYNGPVEVQSVHPVKSFDEAQLMAAIANGVTSVTVQSASTVFWYYTGGVLTSSECGTALDHAITAVGYGTTEDGIDYYLVRNSWGAGWGDNGYIKIGRNGEGYGICGVQEISVWATTN